MPTVRSHMSMMSRTGWRIRQIVRIAHRHLTLPRNRMTRMPWTQICTLLMPHCVISSIDVGIVPVGGHLCLILFRIIYVHRRWRRRNPRRGRVPTWQILRLRWYIFRLPWIQSRLSLLIHRLFYDVPLQSV